VVEEHHYGVVLLAGERREVEAFGDLEFRRPDNRTQGLESLAIDDVASLDGYDLSRWDGFRSEDASPLGRACPDLGLGGAPTGDGGGLAVHGCFLADVV
jgi:hypothetical protein